MSALRIISLIVAAVALIAALILGMMIMNGKKALVEKFDATLEERWKGSSASVKDKPAIDKLAEFNRRTQAEQQELANTQGTLTQTTNKYNEAVTARGQAETAQQAAEAAKTQAENNLADAQNRLRTAEDNLATANNQLQGVRTSLSNVTREKNELQRRIDDMGDAPQKVKTLTEENAKLKADAAAANAQVAKFQKENEDLKKISPDLVGSVVKADPAWSFIVLDLGKEHSTGIEGSNFFVYRGDHYKGEVKVTRADRRVSVADLVLLPSGVRAASIVTGDKVLASRLPASRLPATSAPAIAPSPSTPRTTPRPAPAPITPPDDNRQQNFGPRRSDTEPTPVPAPKAEPAPKPAPVAKPAPEPKAAPAPKPAPAAKPAPEKTEAKPAEDPEERKMNFGSGRKSPALDE